MPFDQVRDYCAELCKQIRWRRAHGAVTAEIEGHIVDQRDAYIADGLDEASATEQAIRQMGDPIEVGSQFDRVYRPQPQWLMLGLTLLLLAAGLAIRLLWLSGDELSMSLWRQVIGCLIGPIVLFAVYFLPQPPVIRAPKTAFLGLLIGLAVLTAFSVTSNGASYFVFGLAVSLSGLTLLFPAAFAGIIYLNRGRGYAGLLCCDLAFIVSLFFIIRVPALTGGLIFAVAGTVLLVLAVRRELFGCRQRSGMALACAPFAASVLLFAVQLLTRPYLLTRLQAMVSPELDPSGAGYAVTVIRSLLTNAHLIGPGTLPEQYAALGGAFPLSGISTDYLLTYLIFRVGWIALLGLAALFAIFIVKGFVMSARQTTTSGLLVSTAVMLTFTGETLVYIAANLGLPMASPLSLPLLSYGSTAIVVNLFLIGMMLSVFRSGSLLSDRRSGAKTDCSRIRWQDGQLTIDFKR